MCSILVLNAGAERISRDEALALAQDFMQGKVMMPAQASSSKAPVRGGANDESFYIFNAADNGGYAIIAADDRISPVLGFSDQGNIDLDNMPENMASWLEYYEYEINSLKSDADIVLDTPVYRNEVKPMLNSYWSQEYPPYNLLCPVYDGIQCPVGCTALAMAQIMYYHKWPVGVVDSIPPYANSYHNYELVEGLPATTFKWDLMKPSYNSYEADESAYAVAELMRYCGQAIKMGYTIDNSYAGAEPACKALIERFSYSRLTKHVYKYQYSSYDWDELIYNELASGRPVLYAGYRTRDGGHAFVCDGYRDCYFHINWGVKEGYLDGYFKLSILSMEEPGLYNHFNFGYFQQAIIGIEPEKDSTIGITFADNIFRYTILSDTSVMIQAIDGKDYVGTDTLWIPEHVDYDGNRYYVTRLGESENLNYDFKKVCLPLSLKQIDTEASFLQTIREFTITSNIETLSSTAFFYNTSLERFIAEEDSRYKIIDGVLFSPDGKGLMCYPQDKKDTCYTVPDGIETIGILSFYNNKNLSEVILPDCVEHINDCAFLNCTYLKKIEMSENLKDIGYCAFDSCFDLSNVILPQKIGTIYEYAFRYCSSLKSIIIPNSLNYCLAAGTFLDCFSLESVYIPSSIELIRSDCFKGCCALKEIIVESVVPPVIQSNSVFDDTVYENALLKVPASKIDLFRNAEIWSRFKHISAIPSDTINGINYDLIESAKIAVVVPGKEPYSGDIVIPDTVEYNGIVYYVNALQPATFAGCQDLTSVAIDAPVAVLPDSLFKDCSSLKSIKLNDGIVKIGHFVFYGCSALEAIDIPQGVASIGESLFRKCKSLRSITFPESVRLLGPYAFEGCTNLDSVTFCGFMHQLDALVFNGCTNLTYVSLPQNLTRILDDAFSGCSSLQTITIPESVTEIYDGVFYNCTSLTTIDLPEGLTYISEYAFYGCQSLESITIPESVASIGAKAFRNCQSLKSVTLPDGITFIGNNAFNKCSSLDSIVIPQGMEKIEKSAFDLCINLKSVILPESITELDMYAFIECYSLSTITIPANVRKIGKMAFEDCRSMTSFYCCVEDPQEIELGEDVFNRINEDCILYVPQGCAQSYRDDERWNAFSEIREFDVTQVEPVPHQAAVPVEYYNLSGSKLPAPQQGINIIRYSDGTVRKVTR